MSKRNYNPESFDLETFFREVEKKKRKKKGMSDEDIAFSLAVDKGVANYAYEYNFRR